jgi:hypothetical protein
MEINNFSDGRGMGEGKPIINKQKVLLSFQNG